MAKLEKKDLKEDVSIYDTNHNLKTNFQKLLSRTYACPLNDYTP